MTPFQHLKQNIDKIKFDCDAKYIPEYKRAFCAVLDKMDKYFKSNNLYSVVDYQPIVESMLDCNGIFSFVIDEELSKKNWAGVHKRFSRGGRQIGMGKEYMGRGTTTEGVLCHEFVHHLTIGPEVLSYIKDGEKYETQLPVWGGGFHLGGMKRNLTKQKVDGLDAGDALDGGFICEALTELFKQEIYSEEECYHSYPAQTSLIKLLNTLTGTKVNLEDFLRGDLPNYVRVLGRKNFQEFNRLCDEFQKKHNKNARIDYTKDADYMAAQDLMCKTILQNIEENPEQYSVEQYVKIAGAILTQAPVIMANSKYAQRYKTAILSAGNAITSSQPLEFEEKQKFSKLLKTTIDKSVRQGMGSFNVPSPYVDFSLKKTGDGFAINFKGGQFISSSLFPKHYASKIKLKDGDKEIFVEVDTKGTYQITAIAPNSQPQVIKIVPNKTNASELLIKDVNNADIFKLNFEREKRRLRSNVEENLALLSDFRQYDNIETILKENATNRIYNIKKVISKNGEVYLVANSSKGAVFYKITPNGYKRVDVVEQQTIENEMDISQEVQIGKDESTSLRGYIPSGETTDEFSQIFKLENGTTFVRYFDKSNIEQIGEQITPFANLDTKVILPTENSTLYSKGNEDMADLTSAVADYASKLIKRELSQWDLLAEKKAQEEESRRIAMQKQQMQEEKDRRLEEERKRQRIMQEEIERRKRKIEEERRRRAELEAEMAQHYEKVEEKSKKQGPIYDNFGIDISEIEEIQRQNSEYLRRGR